MLCARETPSRVHARVTTRESSTGPPVSVTQLDCFGVHVFFGRPFLYHFLSPLAVADLRRAAGAVHPWRWPPPVATRYLLSRLWVHCGAERRNLGGWRGGTVGGHPGQDVEGRPTPAVPSPSVSSGNTWICRAFAAGGRRRARRRLRGACCRWTMDLWSAGAEAAERSTRGACTTDCVAGERRVVDDGLERRSDDNEAAMGAEGSGVCRPGRAAVAEA